MSEYQFSVNLGGMIDILSNHLYSTPKVFLRELLQNAVDAVNMRTQADSSFSDPEINITVDEHNSLTFKDSGIGLTEEEIHKFISVIGQSSKREKNSTFIGRFGIGLLSCFIVTDEIILKSRSLKTPDKVHEWHGFADGKYSVREIESNMGTGTEIFIKSDEKHRGLFETADILKNIRYYGLPIPYPV
ncbi:MAG: ATP-binding protein [Ruminococcus sp.]|nr:ATP-binding protein [Ruminococcus sp.]